MDTTTLRFGAGAFLSFHGARVTMVKQVAKTVWSMFRDTYQAYSRDNATHLAAAIAFYAVFSVAPLLIIATAIAGVVFGKKFAQAEVAEQLDRLFSPETRGFILNLVEQWSNPTTGALATAIGLGTLAWGAYRLFMALQDSLNIIWNVRPRENLSKKAWVRMRLLPFAMVLLVGLLLLASMLASAVLSALDSFFSGVYQVPAQMFSVGNAAVSFALMTVMFAAVFKILPDARVRWRDVWVGAAITAFLFVLGKSAVGYYLGHTSTTSIFGAAGSLVALLFWVYFTAQIFFFGAEFTQVYSHERGERIMPDEHAVRAERRPPRGASPAS